MTKLTKDKTKEKTKVEKSEKREKNELIDLIESNAFCDCGWCS